MKPTPRPVTALLAATALGLALPACNASTAAGANPATAGGAPSAAKVPGIAQGKAVDAQGKPLAGVNIDITGTVTANGQGVSFAPTTDASGMWRQEALTPGSYKFRAWRKVTYNGRDYNLPLWSPQGKHNDALPSQEGIARDFVWKISGEKPGALVTEKGGNGANYGGTIWIYGASLGMVPLELPVEGTKLVVKLVPDGPLMDGTAGKEIVETVAFESTGTTRLGANNDVPLGKYTVTAEAKLADGSTKPVRVCTTNSTDEKDYKASNTLEFLPNTLESRPYQESPVAKTSIYMML